MTSRDEHRRLTACAAGLLVAAAGSQSYAQVVPTPPAPVAEGARSEIDGRKMVSVEIFGSGFVHSINYSRIFGNVNVRGGMGFLAGWSPGADGTEISTLFSLPFAGSYLLGKGLVRLELGGGVTLMHAAIRGSGSEPFFPGSFRSYSSGWLPAVTGLVGVRIFPAGGRGFTVGLAFTPVIAWLANAQLVGADSGTALGFHPWGGVNVGYQF